MENSKNKTSMSSDYQRDQSRLEEEIDEKRATGKSGTKMGGTTPQKGRWMYWKNGAALIEEARREKEKSRFSTKKEVDDWRKGGKLAPSLQLIELAPVSRRPTCHLQRAHSIETQRDTEIRASEFGQSEELRRSVPACERSGGGEAAPPKTRGEKRRAY